MSYTVGQLAALLGCEYKGDGTSLVETVSSWEEALPNSLIYWDGEKEDHLRSRNIRAACMIAPKDPPLEGISIILSANPKLDFAKAADWLYPQPKSCGTRHGSADISSDAVIGGNVEIGPYVLVEAGAIIGDGSILQAGVVIGRGCVLGKECVLHPGVVLYSGVQIGDRVVLHAGVVIGSDGFGYVSDGDRYWKFPQAGAVIVDDDVEIGANTAIDRGSLGTTRIGKGSKIDNLVQIAHNVVIGRHVVIASQTGISGSTVIEDYAVIGGQVGFGDHAYVQKGAVIGSKAGVLPGKIVRSGDVYWGVPVRPLREYKRLNALFGRLPDMKSDIDLLKKEVAQLKDRLRES
jgi:UDP-3-O-[3-hydroxymyristoyl] glucosamine N-acyltransferase